MKRSAFTLMELMVSVVLIVMITLFLYNAIASMKLSNRTLAHHDQSEANRTKVFELLYRDFVESVELNVSQTQQDKYNIVSMQTHNSLHEIIMPYVVYYVHSEDERLIRLESAKKLSLPLEYEDRNSVFADVLFTNVKQLNVVLKKNSVSDTNETNASENLQNCLIYLDAETLQKPILFELAI